MASVGELFRHPLVVAGVVALLTWFLSWVANYYAFHRQRRLRLWERRLERFDELIELVVEAHTTAVQLFTNRLVLSNVHGIPDIGAKVRRSERLACLRKGYEKRKVDLMFSKAFSLEGLESLDARLNRVLLKQAEWSDRWGKVLDWHTKERAATSKLSGELEEKTTRLARLANLALYDRPEPHDQVKRVTWKMSTLANTTTTLRDKFPLEDLDAVLEVLARLRDELPQLRR